MKSIGRGTTESRQGSKDVFEIEKQKGQRQIVEEFPSTLHKGFDAEFSSDDEDDPDPIAHLQILKFYPNHSAPSPPTELRITFSQTMFSFPNSFFLRGNEDPTGIETAPTLQLPVVLHPGIEGKWKWLNGNTLQFKPKSQFPMATTFTVTAPRGTSSLLGGELIEDYIFRFSTPTVQVVSHYPETVDPNKVTPETVGVPDQLIVLEFNQVIHREEILQFIRVSVSEEMVYTADDLIMMDFSVLESTNTFKNPNFIELRNKIQKLSEEEISKWIIFKVKESLPTNATITVTINEGTPSLQGPDKTSSPQSFSFKTFGPCRVRSIDNRLVLSEPHAVYATSTIVVKFTNPIDPSSFEPHYVDIVPKDLMSAEVSLNGDLNLVLARGGTFRSQCKVTFKKEIMDVFGQNLEKNEVITLRGRFTSEISSPLKGVCVLGNTKPPQYPFSTNFQEVLVTISQVSPFDFTDIPEKWKGTIVRKEVLAVKVNEFREMKEVILDLQEFLQYPKENLGHLLVEVEPTAEACGLTVNYNARPRLVSWLQCTDLAITAFEGQEAPYVFITSLKDGKPVRGAKIDWGSWAPTSSLWAKIGLVNPHTSAKDGLNKLEIPVGPSKPTYPLIVQHGHDSSFIPSVSVVPSPYYGHFIFYVMNDTPIYFPGDVAVVKGWLRRVTTTPEGYLKGLEIPNEGFEYLVTDLNGKEIFNFTEINVSKTGGFDFPLKIPETVPPGEIIIQFLVKKKLYYRHHLPIFQKTIPDFKIQSIISPGPYIIGSQVTCVASINYQNGGNYANGKVQWETSTEPSSFFPEGWDDYLFGPDLSVQRFPWESDEDLSKQVKESPFERNTSQFTGKTDFQGTHSTTISLNGDLKRPAKVTTSITVVTDKWTQSHYVDFLVHPASYYVGLKRTNFILGAGEPLSLTIVVVDILGKFISDVEVEIEVYLVNESGKEFKLNYTELKMGNDPKVYEWEGTQHSGEYRIRVMVRDEEKRLSEYTARYWVVPSNNTIENFYGIKIPFERVVLIPNKLSYTVGETAKVSVHSPLSGAFSGVLQIKSPRCDQIIQRFDRNKRSFVLDVRIEESFVPSVIISVIVVGVQYRSLDTTSDTRPAYGFGTVELSVPPVKNELQVKVIPSESTVRPGSKTKIDIVVSDKTEAFISKAEVAVVVINNDAVIASGYNISSPLKAMFPSSNIQSFPKHLRAYAIVDNYLDKYKQQQPQQEETLTEPEEHRILDGATSTMSVRKYDSNLFLKSAVQPQEDSNGTETIKIRSNFNALAAFIPSVRTDQEGKVSVEVSLPDTIAHYKVIAVAIWGPSHFGVGEAFFDTYLSFVLHLSAPRYLTLGDNSRYNVVVANCSKEDRDILVGIRGTNIKITDEISGYQLTVPANKRVALNFSIAPTNTGQAEIQVAAISGVWSDAAATVVPVRSPSHNRCVVSYHALIGDNVLATHPINLPLHINPKYGGLSVICSPNKLHALGDNLMYLHTTTHDGIESIASRLISHIVLHEEIGKFHMDKLPPKEKILGQITEDILTLHNCQNEDGTFPYWPTTKKYINLYISIHAAHAVARSAAKLSPWKDMVPTEMIQRCKNFLSTLTEELQAPGGLKKYNSFLNLKAKLFLLCYTIYVRWLFYENISDIAYSLIPLLTNKNPDRISNLECCGLISSVLARQNRSSVLLDHMIYLLNLSESKNPFSVDYSDVIPSNRTGEWSEVGEEVFLYESPVRCAAITLNGFSDNKYKDKIVHSILKFVSDCRTEDSRWGSTQENVWVCLAYWKHQRNIDNEDNEDGFYSSSIFYNNCIMSSIAKQTGDKSDVFSKVFISTESLSHNEKTGFKNKIVLQKKGDQNLYYRLALYYSIDSTKPSSSLISKGFVLERSYYTVEGEDLYRDNSGRYITKVGSLIQIILKVTTRKKRHDLLLLDQCPSAMEPIPESLADVENSESGYGFQWYQHVKIRQNRLEIYTTIIYPGEHIYTYYARTTNTGTFHVPPAKVQEIYGNHYGLSSKDILIVKGTSEEEWNEPVKEPIAKSRAQSYAPTPNKRGTEPRSPRTPRTHPESASKRPVSSVFKTGSGNAEDVITLDDPVKTKKSAASLKKKKLELEEDGGGFENISF